MNIAYYLALLYCILPVYIANMMPVFVRNLRIHNLGFLQTPLDFGKRWRGKRIFGENKTWRGLVFAVGGGFIVYALQAMAFSLYGFVFLDIIIIDYTQLPLYLGAILGLGAMLGDALKSFFKRQAGIKPGNAWIPFDQIDYTVGALVFVLPWLQFSLTDMIYLMIISAVLHLLVNSIGYLLGMRKSCM